MLADSDEHIITSGLISNSVHHNERMKEQAVRSVIKKHTNEEEEEEEDEEEDLIVPNKGVKIFVERAAAVTKDKQAKVTPVENTICEKECAKTQAETSPIIRIEPVSNQQNSELVKTLAQDAIDSAEESLSRESSPEQQFGTPLSSFCNENSAEHHSPQNGSCKIITAGSSLLNSVEKVPNIQPQQISQQQLLPHQASRQFSSDSASSSDEVQLRSCVSEHPVEFSSNSQIGSENSQLLLQIVELPKKQGFNGTSYSPPVLPQTPPPVVPKPQPRIRIHSVESQEAPQIVISPGTMKKTEVEEEQVSPMSDNDSRKYSFGSGDSPKFSTKPKDETSWILQNSVTTNRVMKGAPWAGKSVGTHKVWRVDENENPPQMHPTATIMVTTKMMPAKSEPNLNNSSKLPPHQEQPVQPTVPHVQPVVIESQQQSQINPSKRPGAIASLGHPSATLPHKPPGAPLYINTEVPQVQSATSAPMSQPWGQRQWKSVHAPNTQPPAWVLNQQQHHQQEQQQQNGTESNQPFGSMYRKSWAPVQSPKTEMPPSQFPQPHNKPPPVQSLTENIAKVPPPVLPKPKPAFVAPLQVQLSPEPVAQPKVEPVEDMQNVQNTVVNTAPPKVATGQVQKDQLKGQRQMLYKPGNQWPPPKSETKPMETTPPRQLVQNVEVQPETKMWTLAKPDQNEIKAQLENVIKRPGVRNPRIASNESEPEEFPVLRKVEQKSPSPRPPIEVPDDNEVEHLLRPSDIKATQPKMEDIVGSGSSLSRSPKTVTKETLLNQYYETWEKANNFEEPEVVKCGLPATKRPVEPENTTDVEACIKRLSQNDPELTEINLNNMKRTPIPQIQRLIETLRTNTQLKKLSLANLGLTDNALEPLLQIIETNSTLEMLNIETNFLNGDFLVRLFESCLVLQSLHDVKAVNQSPTFSNQAELNMMKAIHKNRGIWKVSLNLRLPEARQKVDQALIRNGELRRLKRKIEAMESGQGEYADPE